MRCEYAEWDELSEVMGDESDGLSKVDMLSGGICVWFG